MTDEVVEQLTVQGVRLVACTFVDNAGVSRVKVVPISRLASAARHGVGISYVFAVFAVDDHIAASPGFDGPTGDMRLVPDLDAAVALHAAPGFAWAPVRQFDQEMAVMPVCQRSLLERVTASAAEAGVDFLMAYEVEFTLFDAQDRPAHDGPGYSPRALLEVEGLALDLVEALEAQGIAVDQFHPEYSIGQCEVSVGPADPVTAADQYVLLRTTVTQIARRHGLRVSFAPSAVAGVVGNGCHLHLSGWRGDQNLMTGGPGAAGMTAEGEALTAGVLEHLPELPGVLTPSVVSYARLRPSSWAGAFACWGIENREAALRFIPGSRGLRGRAANVELKCIDGTANPYLAAAVVLAAALDGLDRDLSLPEAVQVDPVTLPGVERLAEDLGEAIRRLEQSKFVRATFGDPLFEAFLAVRRLEWESYGQGSEDEILAAHRWRYG